MVGWLRPTVRATINGGDPMSDEIMTRVEKQMEGTNLALAAVAEVLQKMDSRFAADDEAIMQKAEQEAANEEHTALVKEIASAVFSVLKEDNGMDVDGTKVNNASSTGKSAGNADDSEKKAAIDSKTESVQATIQAMLKEDEEEEDEEAIEGAKYAKKGEEDYPLDEEENEEEAAEMRKEGEDDEEDDDEMSEMRKRLNDLKKQVASYEANMEKAIQTESEDRLRKMGFREETSLQGPKLLDRIGVDGTTPIAKSVETGDTVEQLMSLSWKELRNLQADIEMGNTDGVPRELIN